MLPLKMLGLLVLSVSLCAKTQKSNCPIQIAPIHNLTIELYKNNETIDVKSFSETIRTPVNESRVLEIHVSREENVVQFRCEAQLNFEPEGPQRSVVSQTHNLSALNPLEFLVNVTNELRNLTLVADGNVSEVTTAAMSSSEAPLQQEIPVVFLSVQSEEVLSEKTNYKLQCDIISEAPDQNLTIKWYKNDEMTKSFSKTTSTLVNISSILEVTVSRKENIVRFRCEAQMELEPQHPLVSQTHHLSALYAPEFLVNQSDYIIIITVLMGGDLTLSCDADGNPPPEYRWTADDGVDLLENSSKLSIIKVNRSSTYICTATNKLGNTSLSFQVNVTQVTRTAILGPEPPNQQSCILTTTPSEVVVKFGGPLVITCNTSSADIDFMGWESPVGGVQTKLSTVTLTIEKLQDWAIQPFCFATKTNGHQCIEYPSIHLYKTPDFVSVSSKSHGPMKEDSAYELKCDVHNVAPLFGLRVNWYQDNKTVFTENRNFSNEPKTLPSNFSFNLIFTPKKSDNGSLFRCEAELQLGPKEPEFVLSAPSDPFLAVVLYKPLNKDCPNEFFVEENMFSMKDLPCKFEGNPPPTIKWYHKGQLINSYETLNRTDSGTYTAEAVNSMGRSSMSVFITVEHSPSFDCKIQYEVEMNEKQKTLCEPKGIPSPTITWFKNGKEATLPERWTKHDSGNYSLHARNKHGRAEHEFYLDVLYAPEFKEKNVHKELISGGNVTFGCSAEGNPSPEIKWSYKPADNLKETSERRQRIVTITGATSTNVGLYICVATNKVGNVTRTVTLVKREKTSEILIWLAILLAILIFLGLSYICICYRKKKRGHYNIISSTELSSIPMNTNSAANKPKVDTNGSL